MSTRGVFGFRIDGQDKLTYNHTDSYPEGLGQYIVDYIKQIDDYDIEIEKARKVKLVYDNEYPEAADIERLRKVGFEYIYNDTWGNILRYADIDTILKMEAIIPANDFIYDSLMCEWGYIVNLDDGIFEVYQGFQTKKHDRGRYCNGNTYYDFVKDKEYYPCALIKTFDFNKIPKGWAKTL